MSDIYNPFVFTPTGQAMPAAAPPVLRVMEGRATSGQLDMAQKAFYKFCMHSRLSVVPNPRESGHLPDGSRYEIIVVGTVQTMLLWPVGADGAEKLRGVGVSATYANGPARMLVLTYQRGWKVARVPSFYGGSGLWVSKTGARYLTDDTLTQLPPDVSISARRFRPGVADKPKSLYSTSVLRGLAYDNGNNGVGIISRAGKYVQAKQTDLTVEIAEAALVPESKFLQTPEEFVAIPVPLDAPIVAQPVPGRFLGGPNNLGRVGNAKGHLRYSRMRDGSAVFFPLFDLEVSAFIGGNGWISPLALTHELKVDMRVDGGYEATVVPHAEPEDLDRKPLLPDSSNGAYRGWRRTRYDREIVITKLPIPIEATGELGKPGSGRSVSRIIKLEGEHSSVELHTVLERALKRRLPVFVSRDWADKKIEMSLRVVEDETLTTDMNGRAITNHDFRGTEWVDRGDLSGNRDLWVYSYPAGKLIGIAPEPPNLMDYRLIDRVYLYKYIEGVDDNYGGVVAAESIYLAKLNTKLKNYLETPWGELQLSDRNTETTSRFTFRQGTWSVNNPGIETVGELLSVTGTDWWRDIIFIDPILSTIGYVEFATGSFRVTPKDNGTYQVDTSGSTAKFVLRHKGSIVLEFPLSAPTEGSAVVTGTRVLAAGRQVSASGVELTPAPVTKTYSFPAEWWRTRVNDSDLPDYISATITTYIDSGQGTYTTRNFFDQYFLKETTDGPVPRASPPNDGKYNVKVTSAIDPNSGGGVVMVRGESDEFKGAWAIDPQGGRKTLQSVITDGRNAPQQIHDLLISV